MSSSTAVHPPAGPRVKLAPQRRLIADNAILFMGAGFASVLNYLFNPILSRILTIEQFGEVQALNSLVVQLLVLFTVVQLLVVNVVANTPSDQERLTFMRSVERAMRWTGLVGAGLIVVMSPVIRSALNLGSAGVVILLAPIFLAGALRAARTGELQAHQRFGAVSSVEITAAGTRLLLATGLAALGFGTGGATLGLVLSIPLAVVVASRALSMNREPVSPESTRAGAGSAPVWRPHLRFALLAGWAAALIGLFVNADTLLAKAMFDPETAGLYSGVAVIARIVFFVTASIAAVLLTKVKVSNSPTENLAIYLHSAFLLAIPALGVLATFVFAPSLVVRLLVGGSYTESSNLLPWLGASMLAFAFINLILAFHLASRDVGIAIVATLGMVATALVISFNNATPLDLAQSILTGAVVTLVLCLCWTFRWNRLALA